MRSDWLDKNDISHLYAALTPTNALVLRVCVESGLRIGDALSIRTEQLRRASFTLHEQKTGKSRRLRLSQALRADLLRQAGAVYVFPHRNDPNRPRTRQAVYNDIKRAARAFRLSGQISPHSLRKFYAVERLRQTGDLAAVQRELNHERLETTIIYALADRLDLFPRKPNKRRTKK